MPKLDEDIYGADPASSRFKESDSALRESGHELDINGASDERAKSEDNHKKHG